MLVISILITFTCKGGKSRAAQHGKKNGHAFFFHFLGKRMQNFFYTLPGKKNSLWGASVVLYQAYCMYKILLHLELETFVTY